MFPSILRDKAIMVDICGRKNLVTDKFIEEVASSLMVSSYPNNIYSLKNSGE